MDEWGEAMEQPKVELTDPDGNVYVMFYVATLENAGKQYVILCDAENENNEDDRLLIVRVDMTADGVAEYVMPDDEQEVDDVFIRFAMLQVEWALEQDEEEAGSVLH